MQSSPGALFRNALTLEHPLQVAGAINAYCAIMAKTVGFHAIYLSGAGVANASYGLPDLGLTTLDNVLEDASHITSAVPTPLLVDIDTGWEGEGMIAHSIEALERAGVAGVHLEDQISAKRCGHLAGKQVVPTEEMVERIVAAVEAKEDPDFVIMARTDAFAHEGLEGVISRALAYKKAGADMLFPEALPTLADFRAVKEAVGLPILANLTEFGKTPLFTADELGAAGIDMALYPLSAFRAMNKAALNVYKEIRRKGTQQSCLEFMQTRKELYHLLHYDEHAAKPPKE